MLLAALATLLIAVSKGGFGGGAGALATPLLLLAVRPGVALALVLPLLIVCDVFTLRHFPRDWHPRSFWLVAPGTFLGLFVGLYFLVLFARHGVDGARWIRLIVGVTALAFCVIQGARRFVARHATLKPGIVLGTITGLLCGFTTMVAHAAGALIDMFLVSQRIEPRKYVGTCARFYLTFNTIKIPFYVAASAMAGGQYLTWKTLQWDLWLVPLCPLGVGLGVWLHRRMSDTVFLVAIYIMLGLVGVKMVFDAIG
jgi:hypothetical protein